MEKYAYLSFAVVVMLAAAGLRLIGLAGFPPGPHYDEAVNVIITRTIAYGGARPFPMIENYQGREILYYYLSVPALTLVHNSRFALQLVGVYCNLLLVAATIALGRWMFAGQRGIIIGLAAGGVAAISLPQVLLARQAFRSITLPTFQALALLLLWVGLRRNRYHLLGLGGAVAGLSVYTYNASRLFPIWLLVAGLVLLVVSQNERAQRLREGVVFFGALGLVVLPFGVYGITHPDIFLGRLYEVSGGENALTLTESIGVHLKLFFIEGESLLRYNPRGRAYFTWLEGGLLLVGFGVALWRLLRSRQPIEQTAAFLLLLAPLMIIPSVISTSGFPPNHMRSIAMIPLIFLLIGVGIERFLRDRQPILVAVVLGVGLLLGTAHTARDYANWVTRADLFYETDADLAAAAQWVQSTLPDTPVYIAAQDRFHPTVQVFELPHVRWLGTDTLFLPPDGEAVAIFPRSAPPSSDWAMWLNDTAEPLLDLPQAPDGQTAFEAYRLDDTMSPPMLGAGRFSEARNPYLSLISGYTSGAYPNGILDITTSWQIETAPPYPDLTPILHMEDALGQVIARAESFSVGTDRWEAGATLIQQIPGLRVPVGTPPGDYQLRLTWVGRASDRYIPYQSGGVWADVGTVTVLRPNVFPPAADLPVDVQVNAPITSGVQLVGWNTIPAMVRPGERLPLVLHWQATQSDRREDFLYALQLNDSPLMLEAPLLTLNPPSRWLPGQLMTERLLAEIPAEIEQGAYPLQLRAGEQVIELGVIQVMGLPRQFTPPPYQTVINQSLGDQITLVGYTLQLESDQIDLNIVWQAETDIDTDYTVFVHLIDAETGELLAQQDRMPLNNTYPTSLWVSGEFITERYVFDITDGRVYQLRVGLYNQQTGERLRLASQDDSILIDFP